MTAQTTQKLINPGTLPHTGPGPNLTTMTRMTPMTTVKIHYHPLTTVNPLMTQPQLYQNPMISTAVTTVRLTRVQKTLTLRKTGTHPHTGLIQKPSNISNNTEGTQNCQAKKASSSKRKQRRHPQQPPWPYQPLAFHQWD